MRLGATAAAAVCAMVLASPAFAHAFLDHAEPAVGSTVRAPPAQIRMWFTQRLEPAFSKAELRDESGKPVEGATAKVESADPTLLQMFAPPLKPGRYSVTWRVLSVDTHVTQGDFSFSVAP